LLWGDEAAAFMKDYWPRFDTVVMGRLTYEQALKQGMGSYPGMATYVCSRTMPEGTLDNGVTVTRDAIKLVDGLRQHEGRDICLMGGGLLAQSLFEAGLIDEIGFNLHPVLLGSGIPLYHEMNKQIDLELIDCQVWKNGCVLVQYRVKKVPGAG
jgi:dihydrofolate reductase